MTAASDRLQRYLTVDEPLAVEFTARLTDDATTVPVSVAVTDRRLLCVGTDERMVSVDYDAICAIRSEERTDRTYRGLDYRLLLGAGGLVTALALVGIGTVAASLVVPFLALLAVGGLGGAAFLQWTPEAVPRGISARLRRVIGRVCEREAVQRVVRRDAEAIDEQHVLLAGSGTVGVAALLATVVLAPSITVLLGTLGLGGGAAVIAYAYRRRDEFDGFEVVPRHQTELRIRTVDGATITLTGDSSAEIDRALSRLLTDGLCTRQNVSAPV